MWIEVNENGGKKLVKESKELNFSCTSEKGEEKNNRRNTDSASHILYEIFPHLTVSRSFLVTLLILCVIFTAEMLDWTWNRKKEKEKKKSFLVVTGH